MSAAKFKIESGVQLLTRLSKKPDLANFYPAVFRSGPKYGEVIEVVNSGTASNLIIDIIAEALIQTRVNGVPAGVLIFNTDGMFCFEHLCEALKKKTINHLQKNNQSADEALLDNILKDTVTNFYVVNIYDETQFYTTIHNLESIMIEHSNISLLIFNTLTAFYWSEQQYKISKMDLYLKNLINTIKKVTKEYKTICLFTRPEYFSTINKDCISTDIDYRVQLIHNTKSNYQVNINSTSFIATNFFKIVNKELTWL